MLANIGITSIINPLKEFSKAFYNIPLGLASMDRIDMILKADSHIKDPVNPLPLAANDEWRSRLYILRVIVSSIAFSRFLPLLPILG